jgi:predicted dienelactone hydrolase
MTKPNFPSLFALLLLFSVLAEAETVTFPSGEITLHGVLYKPEGTGPFPAVVYNHGSAPGMMSKEAFAALGPVFASHGWVFFGPYRRGQGLSASAGPYIGDQNRGCRENRWRLCGCRNDGAVIGDRSF